MNIPARARRAARRRVGPAAVAAAAVMALVAGCSSTPAPAPSNADPGPTSATAMPTPVDPGSPKVRITELASGLNRPWDAVRAPDGTVLTGERSGRFVAILPDGRSVDMDADISGFFASGETGLMGIALDPRFAENRTLYTCEGHRDATTTDIQVRAWVAAEDWTRLVPERVVIGGFPVSTGRHGGCRILAQPDGTLWIGTGDAARPTVPQDPNSLGGKVLRVVAATGQPPSDNPIPGSPVYTLGHRNVQGLAARPGTDQVFSVEQGSTRDDEVNLLRPGANYGWKPDRSGSGYDESVAMTDPDRVPGAVPAVWSSGPQTIATASGTFLTGDGWGAWNGALALGVQKGKQVLLLGLSDDGTEVLRQTRIDALSGPYGRIRTVTAQPDGSMLVTTDNGGNDKVLLVSPE